MTPANDVAGPYTGRGNANEWGARYAETIRRIMAADLDVIPKHYDRAANLFYPGGQDGLGWSDADQFWLGLRAVRAKRSSVAEEGPARKPFAHGIFFGLTNPKAYPVAVATFTAPRSSEDSGRNEGETHTL